MSDDPPIKMPRVISSPTIRRRIVEAEWDRFIAEGQYDADLGTLPPEQREKWLSGYRAGLEAGVLAAEQKYVFRR